MKVSVIVFVRCLETDVAIMSVVHFWTSELVETILSQMQIGKAAGLDELTIEHLVNI